MNSEELNFSTIDEYQTYLKERQELLGYCKKISLGIDNLDEKSGERAIWELVQNARDRDECCQIRIELKHNCIVFSHHGEPFDYLSLLALVNQNSSKDNPGADLVGQYGTGFMTTHAFNDIVSVDGPYKAMKNPSTLKGYVKLGGFELNRSYRNDTEKFIKEMRNEMKLVSEMHAKTPLYQTLDESDKWTSFTYMLNNEQIANVSRQLASVIRLIPMVLVINERIKNVEIVDRYTEHHFIVQKTQDCIKGNIREDSSWMKVTNTISTTNLVTGTSSNDTVTSLQSGYGSDIILLPPYPTICGNIYMIPSLFLWFPLLGTERFGVNFIFHSKRFFPVEKRNNILLPENVPSKLEKGLHNESVLKEMMKVLHEYYAIEENSSSLTREMCIVSFKSDKDDEVTTKFYEDLQELWKVEVPKWKVIPTTDGYKSMNDVSVKVLHPDFYSKLTDEKRIEYEPTLAAFANMVKYSETESYLLPTSDLIAWSETVNEWNCNQDADFFITVEDVCKAIQNESADLHKFLMFLKESENTALLDKYALLPNRKGNLRKKGDLSYGEFMTEDVYNLINVLMGEDGNKMIDPVYLDITNVGNYTVSDLHGAITGTIANWRRTYLNENTVSTFTDVQLSALLIFCSSSSQQEYNNQRGRLIKLIPALFGKIYKQQYLPKLEEKEDDFYSTPFNFMVDYTLLSLSLKQSTWVNVNKKWLLDFLTEYATSTDKDWVGKLNQYGVLPSQLDTLCIKDDLNKNDGIKEDLAAIYKAVFAKDLHEDWADTAFEDLFELTKQTPEEIAKKIEEALENDIKIEDTKKRHFDKILRAVILKLSNSEDWRKWFGHIEDKKANYTFNMKGGDVQKSLFTLMDLADKDLQDLAELSETVKMSDMIEEMKRQRDLKRDNDARFYHLHSIGKHIEDVLRNKIGERNIQVEVRKNKEDVLVADDIQNGQDIVVKLLVNEEWKEIYYIEVKSKWNFKEPAHMSTRQVRMASLHSKEYSLCCVDLREHTDKDLANLSPKTILDCTKVKMNIGDDLRPMMTGILEAEERSEDIQIKISEYRSNMSAKVFEVGESFQVLLDRIENIAKQNLNLKL